MEAYEVPEVVVVRLPLYLRALAQIAAEGSAVVSSQQLGQRLQMTPAQIRKDLSYFGRFGKQGRGYDAQVLLREIRQILGLDRSWRACLVGVGRLGLAIINYPGFTPEGFEIVAAFDDDPGRVNQRLGALRIQSMSELAQTVKDRAIDIGIVAVPASQAQSVIDQLVETGLRGILNYAPIAPQVSRDTVVRNIDPVLSLQSMTFYMQRMDRPS